MNTIIIHLESISILQLQQFPKLYDKLYNIPLKCSWFYNFHSTCTSTIMAIADVLSSDMGKYEKSASPLHLIDSKPHSLTLSEIYANNKAFFYPKFWNDEECLSLKKLFSSFEIIDDYECFRDGIAAYMRENEDFMLFIYDGSSSLAAMDRLDSECKTYIEQWYEGKLRAIKTVYHVIECMRICNIQDKTQIIIYGDHGNDFSHKCGGGFTHCFEPYNSLIHVPLIYYHPRLDNNKVENVFSMKGLFSLIVNGVNGAMSNRFFASYINQIEPYAYARNMYAMQSDVDKKYRKAYSITNGEYSLIASTGGVEMYASLLDYTNHCNLLDYFTMSDDGKLLYKNYDNNVDTPKQFLYVMNENRAHEIIKNFTILKSRLIKMIERMAKDSNPMVTQEIDFNTIRHN